MVINEPENYFELLEGIPDIEVVEKGEALDMIHFFTKDEAELKTRLPKLKPILSKNGMLWVSWPKKASKVPTTVDEGLVRMTGLDAGLVDVKICAVDKVWSGLKFVYRVKDR